MPGTWLNTHPSYPILVTLLQVQMSLGNEKLVWYLIISKFYVSKMLSKLI